MSDGRKKLSGAEYRKRARERSTKTAKEIEKAVKIDSFFSKKETPNTSSTTPNIIEDDVMDVSEDTIQEPEAGSSHKETEPPAENILCAEEPPVLLGISHDPAEWLMNDATRDYVAIYGFNQNMEADFSKSKRLFGTKYRMVTKNMFEKQLVNEEKKTRPYLVYSESTGRLFCAPCRLFGGKSPFALDGFNDWKNSASRLNEHERSMEHKTCVLSFHTRGSTLGKINKMLTEELNSEIKYWRNVLKRVVSVVKALGTHGLAFRGSDDRFGSQHSGNFKMLLEVIAEYDPFLSDHITRYGNPGKGKTSYLSFATCEQFINVMAEEVKGTIVKEIENEKYFSISVDSTPDISHVDQLSFIIRYVTEDGSPIERFLCFIPNPGHRSERLTEAVLDTLKHYGLNISNCRGQSYDNASNVSGHYSGLQARIKQINPLAVYIPCSAHSLNLVGTCAAESCKEACSFFELLQHLYVFFTASTSRWEILQKQLSSAPETLTIKRLSETRWSAREEACRSLNRDFEHIVQALSAISEDNSEKAATRCSADGLLSQLHRLETVFMANFWGTILERFQAVTRQLQKIDIDVSTVIELYDSLVHYVQDIRDMFDTYESHALTKSSVKEYDLRFRKRQRGKSESQDHIRNDFRVNTFFVICDNLVSELERRKSSYKEYFEKFEFLSKLTKLETSAVTEQAEKLVEVYATDLEAPDFIDECLHLRGHFLHLSEECSTPLGMLKKIRKDDLHNIYSNVDIALRMFLCTPATNCSAERSFSALKRIKNYLRSSMHEDRLNNLAMLAIESQLVNALNYDDIIDRFAAQRARRKKL